MRGTLAECVILIIIAYLTASWKKKQWRSHNVIDGATKLLVQKLRENNVSFGRVCSIVNNSKSNPAQHIRKEAIRSLSASPRKEMQETLLLH